MNMKTYVLTISTSFPKTHKRSGDSTHFIPLMAEGKKIHTIRANYKLWSKRMDEVRKGNAIISLRCWFGKPYNSKQVEFAKLTYDCKCDIQMITFVEMIMCESEKCFTILKNKGNEEHIFKPIINGMGVNVNKLAENDGLTKPDFAEWFKKYDLSKPMAIIHFTGFRY